MGMRSAAVIVFASVILFGVAGCGTGSPRFSHNGENRGKETARESPVRFSRELQKAAREEQQEDDVKIDVAAAESRIVLPTALQTRMLREILRHIGTPYRLGGMGSDGIDCSAYTWKVFNTSMNIDLPRSTSDQFRAGMPVRMSDLRFGDLVFFNTTGRNPSHVGIYIGDNLFAHASVSYGVTISSLESTYFQRRITGARRIID
jgi:cell wall-associated NlpC family hydrolase